MSPRAEYPRDLEPNAEPVHGPRLTRFRRDPVLVHWSVPPRDVQRRLPAGLRVDTFEDEGWIGVVASHTGGRFDRVDVDVRTYVIDPEGRRTLWLLGGWSTGRAVAAARRAWGLGGRWAPGVWTASGGVVGCRLRGRRTSDRMELSLEASAGTEADGSGFVAFVAHRWGVSAGSDDAIVHADRVAPARQLRRGRALVLGGAGLDRLDELGPAAAAVVVHRGADGPEGVARFRGVNAGGRRSSASPPR